MVSHGHISIDGVKTTIPSRRIFLEERISVRKGSGEKGIFTGFSEKFMERPLPSWLSWNPKTMEGGIVSHALGQTGMFLHELFHDGRHLLGVPCH